MAADDAFLSRWSRRKVQVQRGEPVDATPAAAALQDKPPPAADAAAPPAPLVPAAPAAPPSTEPPPPTLAEAQGLTRESDFRRFVGRGVDPQVKNTALKTLFSDPHFNIMDGLDTYIDDYGKPDPLPPGMLRQMAQSAMLGLFADEPAQAAPTVAHAPVVSAPPAAAPPDLPLPQPEAPPDEDTDLRLQRHDEAGRAGTEPRAGANAAGEH